MSNLQQFVSLLLNAVESNLNLNLFGGDIVLSQEQVNELAESSAEVTGARHHRGVVTIESNKWTNGVVPYEFSSDFSECGSSKTEFNSYSNIAGETKDFIISLSCFSKYLVYFVVCQIT